jgi:hypothetical protein
MSDPYGLMLSVKVIFKILVTFGFLVGTLMSSSLENFQKFRQIVEQEYGIKKKIIPKIETKCSDVVDRIVLRNRVIFGVIISAASFLLLLISN